MMPVLWWFLVWTSSISLGAWYNNVIIDVGGSIPKQTTTIRMMRSKPPFWSPKLDSFPLQCSNDMKRKDLLDPSPTTTTTRWTRRSLLFVKGGHVEEEDEDFDDDESDEESDEESDDFDYDEDEDDDEDLFGLDDGEFEATEDDFGDDARLKRLVEAWHKTPPFTKAYLTASACATAMGYLTNTNHEFPNLFLLDWKPILTRLQLWRPITAFLNFGPFGLGYLMTAQFVWTYMATLERLNHDRPYDFWLMILFGCASMIAGYTLMNISPKFLGHNLSTFLVYIWSRYHEGLEVNMFELFNTRAEMLPWFFLAQTFLLEGEFPMLDLLGIMFGHIYHHCKTNDIIRTPKFIVNWYHNGKGYYSTMIRERYKQISSDFEMAP